MTGGWRLPGGTRTGHPPSSTTAGPRPARATRTGAGPVARLRAGVPVALPAGFPAGRPAGPSACLSARSQPPPAPVRSAVLRPTVTVRYAAGGAVVRPVLAPRIGAGAFAVGRVTVREVAAGIACGAVGCGSALGWGSAVRADGAPWRGAVRAGCALRPGGALRDGERAVVPARTPRAAARAVLVVRALRTVLSRVHGHCATPPLNFRSLEGDCALPVRAPGAGYGAGRTIPVARGGRAPQSVPLWVSGGGPRG